MTHQHTQFGTKRFIWDRGSFLRISNPVILRIATWTLYKSVCLVMTHQHTKFGVPGSIVQKIGTIEIVFEDLNPATLIFKTATQPFCSTLCCDDTFLNLHTKFSSKQFEDTAWANIIYCTGDQQSKLFALTSEELLLYQVWLQKVRQFRTCGTNSKFWRNWTINLNLDLKDSNQNLSHNTQIQNAGPSCQD